MTKLRTRFFKLYQALFIYKKNRNRRWWLLRLGLVKNLFFLQKSWLTSNSKHFCQNTMTPCYLCYFFSLYIFNFFEWSVSLFLAGHDQHLMLFKDSNVFKFTNFPIRTKYYNNNNNTNNNVNNNYNNAIIIL